MKVRLSAAADADLTRILQQGLDQFGVSQVANYIDGLEKLFLSLAAFPNMGVEREEIGPGVRSQAYKAHLIFYRTEAGSIFITRIRHGREDCRGG